MCKINTISLHPNPLSLQRNMTTPWLDFIPNERQDTALIQQHTFLKAWLSFMDSPNQGLIESYLLSDTVLHSSSHLQESVCVYDRRRREWGH